MMLILTDLGRLNAEVAENAETRPESIAAEVGKCPPPSSDRNDIMG
ncbi:hypothetical protein QUF72_12150 [Desulfobacterales bacterium HSG2]|nr:hypothetical protein [Desulfobacterales bacterium HSG2]